MNEGKDLTFNDWTNIDYIFNDNFEDKSSSTDYLVRLITSSQIYKEAYKLFSSDLRYGQQFLQDLVAIPESYRIRDDNFWDDLVEFFGGTSNHENLINDSFQQAMDEIRKLVQAYYDFINTLPETQVDQFNSAGINSAITGQGIVGSDVDSSGVVSENLQSSDYAAGLVLSQGVQSFVDFIGSVNSLVNTGFTSESLMGMLDLAEREGYNKQQVHDVIMSQYGIAPGSPYSVLSPDQTSDYVLRSSSDNKLAAAQSKARADVLDSTIAVNVGNDPNKVQSYELYTGRDVLAQVSQFKMATEFHKQMIDSLVSQNDALFSNSLSYLENEYKMADFGSKIAMSDFNKQFYNSRSGYIEGKSQTSVAKNLSLIRKNERFISDCQLWLESYKHNTIKYWSEQVSQRPSLAPFLYKAIFDFGMEDTFYHQSPWTQGLKYGLDNINKVGNIVSNFMGIFAPKDIPMPKLDYTFSSTY